MGNLKHLFLLIRSLFDQGAWLLMLPAAIALIYIDPAMAQTIGQWVLVPLVLAGLTIIITRIMFPQVSIAWLVAEIRQGNVAAGLLAAALVLFVGLVFLGMVLWVRA